MSKEYIRVFHGTTDENFDKILEMGCLSPSVCNKVWNVSEDGIYFWNPDEILDLECLNDTEEAENYAKQRAIENATCAFGHSRTAKKIIIISFLIEEDKINPDDSCQNMGGAGVVYEDVPVKMFDKVWESKDISLFRPIFMSLQLNHDMANEIELTNCERDFLKSINRNDSFNYSEVLEEIENELVEIEY